MILLFPHAFASGTVPSKSFLLVLTFGFDVQSLSGAGQTVGTCGASTATHE